MMTTDNHFSTNHDLRHDLRFSSSRPLLAASLALLRDDEVLLALRGKPPLDQLYSLPGGGVEFGETLQETALRELKEEVGLMAHVIGALAPLEIFIRNEQQRIIRHMVVVPFVGIWMGGEPILTSEAPKSLWVKKNGIANLPHTDHLEEIVIQAFKLRDKYSRGTNQEKS